MVPPCSGDMEPSWGPFFSFGTPPVHSYAHLIAKIRSAAPHYSPMGGGGREPLVSPYAAGMELVWGRFRFSRGRF
jgi:hypothetical protein